MHPEETFLSASLEEEGRGPGRSVKNGSAPAGLLLPEGLGFRADGRLRVAGQGEVCLPEQGNLW